MNKILGILGAGLSYFCIGTVIAAALIFGSLWTSGGLNQDKLVDIVSVIYDRDPFERRGQDAEDPGTTQTPLDDIREARILNALNMELRETAMDKALIDFRQLSQSVRKDKERFSMLRESFDKRLKKLQNIANNEALKDVKRTLEIIPPDQAKQQLVKMLADNAMDQVVAIVKSMALDKRKKIFSEFQTPEETDMLYDILREIRLGTGQGELIENTRENLDEPSTSP